MTIPQFVSSSNADSRPSHLLNHGTVYQQGASCPRSLTSVWCVPIPVRGDLNGLIQPCSQRAVAKKRRSPSTRRDLALVPPAPGAAPAPHRAGA